MSDSIADGIFDNHSLELHTNTLESALNLFYPDEKTTLILDGSNVYGACKSLRRHMEYTELFKMFRDRSKLCSIYFFVGVSDDIQHRHLQDVLLWMRKNGVRVRTKTSKKDLETNLWKGNMDVEIAVATLTECANMDHIILASGDGDFVPLVRACQARGQRVTVLSTKYRPDSQLSSELHNSVDNFIELNDFLIAKNCHEMV